MGLRVKRPAQRLVKGIVGSATFSFDLSCAGGVTGVADSRRSVSRQLGATDRSRIEHSTHPREHHPSHLWLYHWPFEFSLLVDSQRLFEFFFK